MLRAILCEPGTGQLTDGGAELIERWEGSPDALLWVLIRDEKKAVERKLLSDRFGIHPMAVQDALRDRHPPKVEAFEGHTFVLLKGLDATTDSIDFGTIQLSLFIGERLLVSRSNGQSLSSDKVADALMAGKIAPDITRAGLALTICRAVADRFMPPLLAVEERLEEIEEQMLSKPNDELLGELIQMKGDLKRLLRIVQYHAQIFADAASKVSRELDGHTHELNDVREQLDRQVSLARLYYDLTDDLMNGYLSLSAHNLNQIMKTLTIVTVIFVPITFMAGIYGMNFENIPELSHPAGYFILLSAMLLVVSGILLYFYWRGWLGGSR